MYPCSREPRFFSASILGRSEGTLPREIIEACCIKKENMCVGDTSIVLRVGEYMFFFNFLDYKGFVITLI